MSSTPPDSDFYESLAAHLASLTPLTIEILPSTHSSTALLYDLPHLGIPSRPLLNAYLHARALLLSTFSSNSIENQPSKLTRSNSDLNIATKILLLREPEHLSAANWRKRYISTINSRSENILALHEEHIFLTTLLTSPLPRHAKSPILWSHKYWVWKTERELGLGAKVRSLEEELDIVLGAAGRHTANYHAFYYARRVSLASFSKQSDLYEVVERVRIWCFAHPRDISGWTYLAWLLQQLRRDTSLAAETVVVNLVHQTERFKDELGWQGMSVEWFLKDMAKIGVMGEAPGLRPVVSLPGSPAPIMGVRYDA